MASAGICFDVQFVACVVQISLTPSMFVVIAVYLGFIVFAIWVVLNIVRSLERLADNQQRSNAIMTEICEKS